MVGRVVGCTAGVLILASGLLANDPRGPSTPEERAKAVQMVQHLENDPLSSEAKQEREWLTVWLIEVPDIHATLCTAFYPDLLGTKKNYANELVMQAPYAMAVFQINHPDQASDENSRYMAGVDGTLNAYEAILKKKPKARWPVLDELLGKRARGELVAFVREKVPECKNK